MFEIQVRMISPMSYDDNLDRVLVMFLSAIGYIKFSSERDMESARRSVGYRMFKECFLSHSDKMWGVEELISYLETSRPTLYRYLNKLKSLDLLEEKHEGIAKKYRLRYGDLEKAWKFVEANINLAMENYQRTVEHINDLVKR